MDRDVSTIVKALAGATTASLSHEQEASAVPRGPVVTLSRDYGTDGAKIAEGLAARLGVKNFDKELLLAVVEKAKTDRYLMERLDEHVESAITDWTYSFITGKSAYADDYRRHMIRTIAGIGEKGGIIVGRGAHLVLGPRKAFRVRITGSPSKCAQRLADREQMSYEKALKEVYRVNHERGEYIRKMYNADWQDVTLFDMVVSTDRFSTDECVEVIIAAMKIAGVIKE